MGLLSDLNAIAATILGIVHRPVAGIYQLFNMGAMFRKT